MQNKIVLVRFQMASSTSDGNTRYRYQVQLCYYIKLETSANQRVVVVRDIRAIHPSELRTQHQLLLVVVGGCGCVVLPSKCGCMLLKVCAASTLLRSKVGIAKC